LIEDEEGIDVYTVRRAVKIFYMGLTNKIMKAIMKKNEKKMEITIKNN
jgi:hypothetical protein